MSSRLSLPVATFAITLALGCSPQPPTDGNSPGGKADGTCTGDVELSLEPAFGTFVANHPVAMMQAPSGTRWYVVEKRGVVRSANASGSSPAVFVDIQDRVNSTPNEAGLLGMAFHPKFATNHQVYLSYTHGDLFSRISRFTSPDNGKTLDVNSETILLEVKQPFDNHNGGNIAFGPDGFLYIGFGDGGSAGDPTNNGQNKNVLLGKMLRIDVDGPAPYGIPSDNPFATSGGSKEIFAWGLRNPWRWSFDSDTGTLWAGDVGQDRFEEIDVIEKGKNYGWRQREGAHCFNPATGCTTAGMTDPVFEYDHDVGISVTGGFVYRGTAFPNLQGKYVFADFGSGAVMAIPAAGDGDTLKIETDHNISSFGQGADGELYALDYGTGKIFHVTGKPCTSECDPGETNCDGTCVDETSDPEHCGSCIHACATGEVCTSGTCTASGSGFAPVYAIIKSRCKACHVDENSGGLSMKTEQIAYDNLVNHASTATGPCKMRTRVTPGTKTSSLIWQKVTQTNLCGSRMPPIGAVLSATQIGVFEDWIQDGAQR